MFFSKYFVIILGAHSKWIEVFDISSITAYSTIDALCKSFARFGLPRIIVFDSGTRFTAENFQNLLRRNDVKQITSPRFHPSSNGAVENAVKIILNSNKKINRKQS